jgi:predicted enzyme related to lactoylglutathione lyase
MSSTEERPVGQHPPHGAVGYVQIPALDLDASATFYETVLGWSVDHQHGGFEAPGLIGQLTTEESPSDSTGPVLWMVVDGLWPALERTTATGGRVLERPVADGGERWLVTVADPAGNRIGLVAMVAAPQLQTMLAVKDVEAASKWYQSLLGLVSDHGGPEYERLTAGGRLVLQLHAAGVEHHHGAIGPASGAVGGGVLVWFGEVTDFDDVVARADRLGAAVLRPPHRNPPEGNGPSHRELWISDLDGFTVVVASPDGEAYEPA